MDDAFDCPSRRGVLRRLAGIGVTTVAAGVLVACGGSSPSGSTGGATADGPADGAAAPDGTPDGAAGSGTPEPGADEGGPSATGGDPAVAEASVPLADVPVGEAVVVDALGSRFVVARPASGEVVAFSAACTHAGTQVEPAGGLELRCPNHGSRFDAGDGGAVLNGPASAPLGQVQARIEGDLVLLSA